MTLFCWFWPKSYFNVPFFATYKDIFYSDKNTMNQLLYIIVIIHQNASINVVGKSLKINHCCVFLNNLIWKSKSYQFYPNKIYFKKLQKRAYWNNFFAKTSKIESLNSHLYWNWKKKSNNAEYTVENKWYIK